MDSNLIKELIRQDLQDLLDFLSPKAIGIPGFLQESLEREIHKIL